MNPKTYEVTAYGPIFYSSVEGSIIKTDKYLSSTALSYALGYNYFDLDKHYVLTGDSATQSDYSPLRDLPLFASDMRPVDVDASERTFRSTSYTEEYNITTGDTAVAERMSDTYNYAFPKIKNASDAGWQELRHYAGISPGSTFTFTVWTEKDLPDTLRFELGIKRTGQVTATATNTGDSADLNEFLLNEVYELPQSDLRSLFETAGGYHCGSDPRLHRYVDVDMDAATELIHEHELHRRTHS